MEKNVAESVFARPASWLTTIPALLAAGIAGLSVLYCLFVIPTRLPNFYKSSLDDARESYAEAVSGKDVDQIRRAAGDLNVIYNRLVLLESGDPVRYWQWAEFSRSYADQLRVVIEQRKDELSEDEFNELQSLVSASREKALDTFEYLSHTESEFRERALLNFVEDKVRRGFVDYSFPLLDDLLPELRELTIGQDTRVALRSAFLYHQIGLETAWGRAAGRGSTQRLWLNQKWLQEMLLKVDAHASDKLVALHHGYLVLAGCLLAESDLSAPEVVLVDSIESVATADWEDRFAQVLAGMLEGEWNDVAFLLARKNLDRADAVRLGAARWICRLAVSEKAKRDAQWRSKYAAGVQIVLQIAPQIPELAELVWLMAREHAGAPERDAVKSVSDAVSPSDGAEEPKGMAAEQSSDTRVGSDVVVESREDRYNEGDSGTTKIDQTVRVPRKLVEAVVGGQAVAVRHMVLAFSSMLSGKADVAGSHLQLTKRSSGTLMQIAHVALGRLRTREASDSDVASLVDLMKMVTDLEAESGLNWFVLGVAYQRQGNLLGAEASLAKADDLLPDVEAIGELLESVRSDLNRQEREKQLRPVE